MTKKMKPAAGDTANGPLDFHSKKLGNPEDSATRPSAQAVLIDHVYTRDQIEPFFDGNGVEIGWNCIPAEPSEPGTWVIFDMSPDNKTGWRRIRPTYHPHPESSTYHD